MDHDDWLTDEFQANRARLRGVAYRMLGSRDEADDAVQETWLRLARTDSDGIENLGGWLTTVIARICLDRLRARTATAARVTVVERPEDIPAPADARDPEHEALVADSVGAALLVVLDALPPAERVAFVLHDVFGVPFDEIGPVVGRSTDAARQLASRARRRVQDRTPAAPVDLAHHRDVVSAFLHAAQGGDFDTLVRLLDPEVVLEPDAAAQRMGTLRPMQGADNVAALVGGGARSARLAVVGGSVGLAWTPGGHGHVRGAMECDIVDGRIVALRVTGDPERLAELDVVLLDS
ncbi:MAG TPA: sigma-70 family RNA polymerase sigma factor [Acidimicrobiia bacterium]|jgi:RNA polymerase sigma-70 factor (ECF subfamily)